LREARGDLACTPWISRHIENGRIKKNVELSVVDSGSPTFDAEYPHGELNTSARDAAAGRNVQVYGSGWCR